MSQDDEFVDLVDDGDVLYDDEEGEDFAFEHSGGNEEDFQFDLIVGKLEEILMEPGFSDRQSKFIQKHCDAFEDSEENKLSYTPIFEEYVRLMEGYLETRLTTEIKGFSMAEFMGLLQSRESEVSGDVFDLLYSLGDFQVFKELMLSEKRVCHQSFQSKPLHTLQSYPVPFLLIGQADEPKPC
eukprot:TRINITY_DN3171_c0_g2_i3.p1 TRINITY_DN3171_c0_g2~~TRINITY_DN3171_c0_g2_i3.p1  ORF type:complete len:183 (-),score=40.52 TRINITY_DN3171_c0_g2_i3:915-1463(-)